MGLIHLYFSTILLQTKDFQIWLFEKDPLRDFSNPTNTIWCIFTELTGMKKLNPKWINFLLYNYTWYINFKNVSKMNVLLAICLPLQQLLPLGQLKYQYINFINLFLQLQKCLKTTVDKIIPMKNQYYL